MKGNKRALIISILLLSILHQAVLADDYNISDETYPEIILTSPQDGTIINTTIITCNATLDGTGTNISSAHFSLNTISVGDLSNCTPAANNIFQCDFIIQASEGANVFEIAATDYGGEFGNSNQISIGFTVDATPPFIAITSPDEGQTYTHMTWPTIIYTYDDAISCDYSLDNGTTWTEMMMCLLDSITPLSGHNYLQIRGEDAIGNLGSSTTIHFIYDDSEAEISITSPEDGMTYGPHYWPGITYTLHNISQCYSSFDSGDHWQEFTCSDPLNPIEGENHLVIKGYTIYNTSVTSSELDFTFSSTPPEIIVTQPTNHSYYNDNTWPGITYTYDDATGCFFTLFGSDNWLTIMCGESLSPQEGENLLNIRGIDAIDNVGESGIINYTYDTIHPTMTLTGPNDSMAYNPQTWPGITYTYDDAINCTYSLDGAITWTNINCGDTINQIEGYNSLVMRGMDLSGNGGETNQVDFRYDSTPPQFNIIFPENNHTYGPLSWQGANYTYDDAETCDYSLDNGTTLEALTCGTTPIPLEGNNILIIGGYDDVGNHGSSTSKTFTWDSFAPLLDIISPENTSYNTNLLLINISTDGITVRFLWNGTNTTYISPVSVPFPEGETTLTVYSTDEANNMETKNVSFLIDTAPPIFLNLHDFVTTEDEGISSDILAEDNNSGGVTYSLDNITSFTINPTTGHFQSALGILADTYMLTITVTDSLANSDSQTLFITVLNSTQQYANMTNVVLQPNITELIINQRSTTFQEVLIPTSIPENTSITLNLANLRNDTTVTLPNQCTLIREGTINYTAIFTNDTTLTGNAQWDGTLIVPQVMNSANYSLTESTIDIVIEIGSTQELNLSQPAKIIIGNMSGKKGGWGRNATILPITTLCNENHTNINQESPRECYQDNGFDLIIWTYHLSNFAAYHDHSPDTTPEEITSTGRNGGNGGGGGGCITDWTCTEWNTCTSGKQTRTCKKKITACSAGNKPLISQTCTETPNLPSPEPRPHQTPPNATTTQLPTVLFDLNFKLLAKTIFPREKLSGILKLINIGIPGKVRHPRKSASEYHLYHQKPPKQNSL